MKGVHPVSQFALKISHLLPLCKKITVMVVHTLILKKKKGKKKKAKRISHPFPLFHVDRLIIAHRILF